MRTLRNTDPDRLAVHNWTFAAGTLVGLWALSPLVSRAIALTTGDTMSLTLAAPTDLDPGAGGHAHGILAEVPASAIGPAARTAASVATALEVVAVLAMLVVVTVVTRRIRPGGHLPRRTRTVCATVSVVAGLVGLIGVNLLTSAGHRACTQLHGACTDLSTWDDPIGHVFVLAGVALGVLTSLTRSETAARSDAEGLV